MRSLTDDAPKKNFFLLPMPWRRIKRKRIKWNRKSCVYISTFINVLINCCLTLISNLSYIIYMLTNFLALLNISCVILNFYNLIYMGSHFYLIILFHLNKYHINLQLFGFNDTKDLEESKTFLWFEFLKIQKVVL